MTNEDVYIAATEQNWIISHMNGRSYRQLLADVNGIKAKFHYNNNNNNTNVLIKVTLSRKRCRGTVQKLKISRRCQPWAVELLVGCRLFLFQQWNMLQLLKNSQSTFWTTLCPCPCNNIVVILGTLHNKICILLSSESSFSACFTSGSCAKYLL